MEGSRDELRHTPAQVLPRPRRSSGARSERLLIDLLHRHHVASQSGVQQLVEHRESHDDLGLGGGAVRPAPQERHCSKSVRIKGTITNGSITTTASPTAAVKVTVDIAGDRAGKNLQAIVNDGTGAIEILSVGGQTYLKADTAYWTKNGSAAPPSPPQPGQLAKIPDL